MSDTLKRHLISAGVTFASAFFTSLGAQLVIGSPVHFDWAFISALVFAAVRAGFKAAAETGFGLSGDVQA